MALSSKYIQDPPTAPPCWITQEAPTGFPATIAPIGPPLGSQGSLEKHVEDVSTPLQLPHVTEENMTKSVTLAQAVPIPQALTLPST